ncbi:hypothetical protein MANI_029879 [Metarhizium anisopliae]|nr:hypothetical protein MANI_029879 [Metarhizium anisopliae]
MEQVHQQPASHVLETPLWMMIVRGLQFLVSLIVLGLAGALMHDLYLDEFGLSVATAILTWCILFYAVFTEKIPPWRTAYHVLAVTVLDGFLVVMWLATFAAVAARRATFKFNVHVGGCVDDGSIIGSKTCFRRQLERRDILFKSGGEMMSSIAGLGALLWLMFIATFVWTIVMFLRGRKEGRFPIVGGGGGGSNNYQMEPKAEQGASVMHPQQTQQQQQYQPYQQPVQPQQTGQHEQSPLGQNPTPAPYQPAQSPYQQQPPYQPPQDAQQYAQYGQTYPSYQQHVQHGSELSATPLPQQSYSPSPVTSSPPPQQEQQYYHQPQQHPQ